MQMANKLAELIRACFTGIWIESHEHEDALAEVAQLCQQEQWRMAIWDIDQGLHLPGQPTASDADAQDPLAAIRSVNSLATEDGTALLVLQNFHRFLQSPEIVQALIHQITTGKQNRTFIVVLAPIVQIPTELEKLFIVLEHQLPDREQLGQIARGIATEDGELPSDTELETVLDAAVGLTRYEAEAAFSLSLVRHDRVMPEAVWELKAGMLKKSGLLSLYRGERELHQLGWAGFPESLLQAFVTAAWSEQSAEETPRRPVARCTGNRKKCFRQSSRSRDRPADIDLGRRFPDGIAGRFNRGQCPPGPTDRRRDGTLHPILRRGGEGVERRGQLRPNRFGCVGPTLRITTDVDE